MANELKLDQKLIHITKIGEHSTESQDKTKPMYAVAQCASNEWQISIEYGIGRSFRDIVFMFSTTGAVSEQFLSCLTVDTIDALREAQKDDHILKKAGDVSDEAALTIVAIATLKKHFADDAKVWGLVERKARKFILSNSSSSVNKKALENAIEELDICYSPFV